MKQTTHLDGQPERQRVPMPPKPSKRPAVQRRRKLGEVLRKAGLIDEKTLEETLREQKSRKKKLGELLIEKGIASDVDIANALASQLSVPFLRLENVRIRPEILEAVPYELADKYTLIPLKKVQKGLVVAIANPLEHQAVDDVRFVSQSPVFIVIAPAGDIRRALKDHYPREQQQFFPTDYSERDITMEITQRKDPPEKEDPDLINLAKLPPVVRFTNAILADAIRLHASDIHIEPRKNKLIVRCRIDGVMHETLQTDKHVHASVVSRLKVVSNLDISVRRKPQDGKTQVKYDGSTYDLRVSTIPTSYGEKVTIRILNPLSAKMMPKDLGLFGEDLERLEGILHSPQGILLVTGPTGSGKSSTLYACLNRLNTTKVNIVTVEDPVEFDVDGISQVQIHPQTGITFAAGLRSILRQDPDIVMVGEIRDPETARIAFQAAQTGHFVLSTLHTNDAASAVTRLLDLQVPDFQISAALTSVLAQRLARRIHEPCKEKDNPDAKLSGRIASFLEKHNTYDFWKGAGCKGCLNTGYSGRIGLFELLMMTPALKEAVGADVSLQRLKVLAYQEGFRPMWEDGVQKALSGKTTLEEVFRVAPTDIEGNGIPFYTKAASERRTIVESFPPEEIWIDTVSSRRPAQASCMGVQLKRDEAPIILIADEDHRTRETLSKALVMRRYRVMEAEDGVSALEQIRAATPDVLVANVDLTGMDGLVLIREMKNHRSTKTIPIIMLNDTSDEQIEIEVLRAGADDYLLKPVNMIRLLARVQRFAPAPSSILVVDDNSDTLKILCKILESEHYSVCTAENGFQALRVTQGLSPALILTDYLMPDMDGIELLKNLKANPATDHIPVILLTGKDEVGVEVKALKEGAEDYITKPVNAAKLLARVGRVVPASI